MIVLRLGKVVTAAAVKGQPVDPLWVEEREVAQRLRALWRSSCLITPREWRAGQYFTYSRSSPVHVFR